MTATNQEAMHASICALLGTTPGTWESDWHALWDSAGIATGPYNGRMLAWLNQQLGASFTNLPGAQAAYAAIWGASSWSALGSITDADATAYFAYSGTLTAGRKALITTLIRGIKTDQSWATLATGCDGFWLLANETSAAALKNLAKDSHHLTAVASPTFEADRGYAGNGSSSYLSAAYNPSTQGVALLQDSSHVSVYNRTATADASVHALISSRSTVGSTRSIELIPWNGSAQTVARNSDNISGFAISAADAAGFWLSRRPDATVRHAYRNGTNINTSATASSALPNALVFIGARNTDATPSLFATEQVAFASVGKNIVSAALVGSFGARIEAYMDAIGAGVV